MLTRELCRIGMRVYFGRANGEQTLGEIVKLNFAKAKVKTLEARGYGRGGSTGAVWGVPYTMMTAAKEQNVKLPAKPKLTYSAFNAVGNAILEAIYACHSALSPENLTCDGELPRHAVHAKRVTLERQLKGLFIAHGSEVAEEEIYDWKSSQQKQQKKVKSAK